MTNTVRISHNCVEVKGKFVDLEMMKNEPSLNKDKNRDKALNWKNQNFKAECVSINLAHKKSDPNVKTLKPEFKIEKDRFNNSQMNIQVPQELIMKNNVNQEANVDNTQMKILSPKKTQIHNKMNEALFQNRKSSVNSQKPNNESEKLNVNLKSFNIVQTIDARSLNMHISDKVKPKPYMANTTASNSASINTPMRMSKLKMQDRIVI